MAARQDIVTTYKVFIPECLECHTQKGFERALFAFCAPYVFRAPSKSISKASFPHEGYTARYEAVNAMLLNEFLKAHRRTEEQETAINELKSTVAKHEATIVQQQKQIEALTTGLQRVSDQLEASKPAPQTVLNGQ